MEHGSSKVRLKELPLYERYFCCERCEPSPAVPEASSQSQAAQPPQNTAANLKIAKTEAQLSEGAYGESPTPD